MGLLAIGALFFGIQSCEYLGVQRAEEKQTKLLGIRNIQFFKDNVIMDKKLENIKNADYLAITMESKKMEINFRQ